MHILSFLHSPVFLSPPLLCVPLSPSSSRTVSRVSKAAQQSRAEPTHKQNKQSDNNCRYGTMHAHVREGTLSLKSAACSVGGLDSRCGLHCIASLRGRIQPPTSTSANTLHSTDDKNEQCKCDGIRSCNNRVPRRCAFVCLTVSGDVSPFFCLTQPPSPHTNNTTNNAQHTNETTPRAH